MNEIKKLQYISMWTSLQPARRKQELKTCPKRWRKAWKEVEKGDKKRSEEELEKLNWERRFLHRLMLRFLEILEGIKEDGVVLDDTVSGVERFKLPANF